MKFIAFLFFCVTIPAVAIGQLSVNTGNDTVLCVDAESASVSLGSNLSIQGGTPPYSYFWYTNDSTFDGTLAQDTSSNPTASLNARQQPTVFYVEVTDDSGQVAVDSMSVRVCGFNPIVLGCMGITPTVGDTITLDMMSGFTCPETIEWFPKTNIVSATNGTSIQVLVSDTGFDYNGYYAVLTNSFGCDTQSAFTCPVVAEVYPAGLPEYGSESLVVYPNPATSSVSINSQTVINHVDVMDIQGKELFSVKLNEINPTLSLDFAPGIYFLRIGSEKGLWIERLLIQ
mgnify:CR=1 FL=1